MQFIITVENEKEADTVRRAERKGSKLTNMKEAQMNSKSVRGIEGRKGQVSWATKSDRQPRNIQKGSESKLSG